MRKLYIEIYIYIYIYIYIKFSKRVTSCDTSLRTLVTILHEGKTSVKKLKLDTVIIFLISLFLQYSIDPLYTELTSFYNKTSKSFPFLCNNYSKNIPSVSNNHYIIKTKILSLFCCIEFLQRRHLEDTFYPMKQ